MKTTLDLDRELLERARRAMGTRTFTEAIETALREAVARVESREAWQKLTDSELSWDTVEDLLDYRKRYGARDL